MPVDTPLTVPGPFARTAVAVAPKSGPPVVSVRVIRPTGTAHLALQEGKTYTIGRHDAADIVVDASEVSRLHGTLVAFGQGWAYQDGGAPNGSALTTPEHCEPRMLEALERVALGAGDIVMLGTETARLELLTTEAPPPVATSVPSTRSAVTNAFENTLDIAARTRVPVALFGPSGSGKTWAARQLHSRSDLEGPFVPLNCARLPSEASALHSELLGHEKGAFTGALTSRVGAFEFATGGTLFLDEVESLHPLAQGFLLDALEGTGRLLPLGAPPSATPLAPTFRVVSATKVPLAESGLRGDLCERLAEGHLVRIPTLAERAGDIPILMAAFAEEQSARLGVEVRISREAAEYAATQAWPGELRQLRGAVIAAAQTRLAIAVDGARVRELILSPGDIEAHLKARAEVFGGAGAPAPSAPAIAPVVAPVPQKRGARARALTADDVKAALDEESGNKNGAARRLGIARNTLIKKMREFGIPS